MAKRIVIPQASWLHGVGHAPIVSDPISNNKGVYEGTLVGYKVVCNNVAGNPTTTVSLQDEDGTTIYTFADTPADNTTTVRMGLLIPLCQKETITIDPNADAGGADTFTVDVVLYFIPDRI